MNHKPLRKNISTGSGSARKQIVGPLDLSLLMKSLLLLMTFALFFGGCSLTKTARIEADLKAGEEAEAKFAAGDPAKAQEAIVAYQRVLSTDPQNRTAFYRLCILYVQTKQPEKERALLIQRAGDGSIDSKERAALWTLIADQDWRCQAGPEKKQCLTQSLEEVEKAIVLNSKSQRAWTFKCIFLRELAEASPTEKVSYEERINDACNRARTLNPNDEFSSDELQQLHPLRPLPKASESKTQNTSTSDAGATGPINGGLLNDKALRLVQPVYPAIARSAHAGGTVTVQVLIDENGNVAHAQAISGHPLLLAASVQAARASKFSATKVEGRPVKVKGVIKYEFTPQ
jgi:TonB family protein